MSRTADIDFSFHDPVAISNVLHALVENGVSFQHQGEVSYVLDLNGMFEWIQVPENELSRVTAEADGAHARSSIFAISAYFTEQNTGGEFMFHKDRKEVSFMATINRRHVFESSKFCDFGWYLDRLVPALEPLGLSELVARDYK
ncbi:hypothetical protein [Streptomyces sp. NBC_01304]|uniref:hypothetical protein n=1 Tax=Streptomyces sp. NBC_01304 TaxID=2903818 RepID=UPI002E15A960|nr:hypothetical protein OG430_27960 [Streptomyces sp. NBC_01304]